MWTNVISVKNAMEGFLKVLQSSSVFDTFDQPLTCELETGERFYFHLSSPEDEKLKFTFSCFYNFDKDMLYLFFDEGFKFGVNDNWEVFKKREDFKHDLLRLFHAFLHRKGIETIINVTDISVPPSKETLEIRYNFFIPTGVRSGKALSILKELEADWDSSEENFFLQKGFFEESFMPIEYSLEYRATVDLYIKYGDANQGLRKGFLLEKIPNVNRAKALLASLEKEQALIDQTMDKIIEWVQSKESAISFNENYGYTFFETKSAISIKRTVQSCEFKYICESFNNRLIVKSLKDALRFFQKDFLEYRDWMYASKEIISYVQEADPYAFKSGSYYNDVYYFAGEKHDFSITYKHEFSTANEPALLSGHPIYTIKAFEKEKTFYTLSGAKEYMKKTIIKEAHQYRLKSIMDNDHPKYLPRFLNTFFEGTDYLTFEEIEKVITTSLSWGEINAALHHFFKEAAMEFTAKFHHFFTIGHLMIYRDEERFFIEKDPEQFLNYFIKPSAK